MNSLLRSLSHTLCLIAALGWACGCSGGPEPGTAPAAEAAPAVVAPAKPTSPTPTATAPEPEPGTASAGGLTWTIPDGLAARQPKSRMRAAEYGVVGVDGAADAELTVFYFGKGQGGTADANVDRWIGQMTQPDGSPSRDAAKIGETMVGKVTVLLLDLKGNYASGSPMGGASAQTDARMLAAVATGPEGPVFFKLVGPALTVDSAELAFGKLIHSLH